MSNNEVSNIADITEAARVAANIENSFNNEIGYEIGSITKKNGRFFTTQDGNTYKILSVFTFHDSQGDYHKAVALKNGNEIYFHFNGTGDGNWGYNAAAYGADPQPSKMQEDCAEWFDKTYEELASSGIITDSTNVYVTGHSQGGNNAMYVTMRSENADKIDLCVPLDGPGFSEQFVSDTKGILGEDYYKQANKIWAFNGEHDFVSILGQESIVPEGHTKYIKYSQDDVNIINFHCAVGLTDKNGNFLEVLSDDSPIRKRLAAAVEKIKDLPQEDQALTAKVIMAVIENIPKDGEFRTAELSSADFEKIKPALIPVLIELLAYNPDEIAESLQYVLGLDDKTAQLVADFVIKFNSYPVEIREQILMGALDLVKIEDGKIAFDKSGVPKLLVESLPVLIETVITNPDDLWNVIQQLGINKVIGDWVKEHPWKTAGIIALASFFAPLWIPIAVKVGGKIIIGAILIDIGIRIVQGIPTIANNIKNAVLDFLESVKSTISTIGEWFHNKFNKGAKYVAEHPFFKADTDLLYHYAERLYSVNSRLRELDSGMRSLYRQVGFLDLWDILCANLITCESSSLNKAKDYLTETAERLITADNRAKGYLEG